MFEQAIVNDGSTVAVFGDMRSSVATIANFVFSANGVLQLSGELLILFIFLFVM